jgi:integrase
MARKRSRIYKRGDRFWGDFRSLGGKREALVPPGGRTATKDPDIAESLAAERVKQLRQVNRNRVLLGVEEPAYLAEYSSRHLVLKAKSGRVTKSHLADLETRLKRAADYFGANRDLASINVDDVQAFTDWLQKLPNGRGGKLGPGSTRHYLNALSNLYRRAASERRVPSGYNPIRDLMDKPSAPSHEANWLEVHDAALLLESARRYMPPKGKAGALPFMYPLIASYLLTGGRTREVLGLEVSDISFDRKIVTFRPHEHRRLKTKAARRNVPLWPQLSEILQEYVFAGESPLGEGLLFSSPRTGAMLRDFRKPHDEIAEKVGWKAGEIRSKMFRHTYWAARLQTLDNGAPVSPYTVARELGHGGDSLVKRIYGHLGEVRHRSEVVEYRVENHREVLGDRLTALTGSGDLPDS